MNKVDLILLHAPAVYDFRTTHTIYGPISDVVPSTPIFDMYPIGFMTIAGKLMSKGLSVRIINIAVKMLQDKLFDVEQFVSSLAPVAFGIDLHWLVHVQGSLELARIVKKYHPKIPVIFGGLSASYYHKELISYPQVDYVIRGDSTESLLVELLHAIKNNSSFDKIPNLTWKNNKDEIWENELSYIPENLDNLIFDYRTVMKLVYRHFDFSGHLPFKKWANYPITCVLPLKGCMNDCVVCGGSRSSYKRVCGRSKPAFRSAKLLAKDIQKIVNFSSAPIMMLGDIRQGGNKYVEEFWGTLRNCKLKNHIAFELFGPCTKDFLKSLYASVPNFNLQISPESHDEEVRKAFGRSYSNNELEKTIQTALEFGCNRIDLFFMIGIPKQTSKSVKETIEYCEYLLKTYGRGKRLHPFIAPLSPFIDPGSKVFETPTQYGYKLFYKTLEEHRRAMLLPTWKSMLNYQTSWMTKDEIEISTYEACLRLNRIKEKYGLVTNANQIEARIHKDIKAIRKIDELMEPKDIVHYLNEIEDGITCEKDELSWPKNKGLKLPKIICELIKGGT